MVTMTDRAESGELEKITELNLFPGKRKEKWLLFTYRLHVA